MSASPPENLKNRWLLRFLAAHLTHVSSLLFRLPVLTSRKPQLAHCLVERAEQDETRPLPILLPLSTWAVRHPPLDEWLSEELARLYDIPPRLSQQYIQAEQVLPLLDGLDGLDEMEEAARPGCVTAINTYHREHLQSLVVCSRTNEYEAAATRERLALHTAVVVQPLSREQVDIHLTSMGKPLAALRAALRKSTALRELATTPLMLQVLMLTYHETSVRELSHKEARLREQIWADYVQRMVSRKGDVKRYPLHVTIAWLGWLAQQMREHNQTIFYLEQLQPDWLPERQRAFYRWSSRLVFGLVGGLVFGLVGGLGGLGGGLVFGLALGLVFGLALGLVGGLEFGLFAERDYRQDGQDTKIKLAETLTWSPRDLLAGLVIGLGGGLLGWLLVGLVDGLVDGLVLGLAGLGTGLALGLSGGFSGEQLTERSMLSPNEGIRRSIKNGLVAGLVIGLVIGLLGGLVIGLVGGLFPRLVIGLVIGLGGGLVFGLGATMYHYILRFWLWHTHYFPWKAVLFLEDASTRTLLRRVGGGYSFIHQLLLDHFADLEQDAA